MASAAATTSSKSSAPSTTKSDAPSTTTPSKGTVPPPPPSSKGSAPSTPSDAELLDILYELLADDTGEQYGVSSETIESFLHEHARSSRKEGAIASFFKEHGLSMRPQDYGRDPALAVVPSGLHMAPWGVPGAASESGSRLAASVPQGQPSEPLDSEPTPRAARLIPAASPVARKPRWLVPALVGLVILAAVAGAIATVTAMQGQQLERELAVSKLKLHSTGTKLDQLRTEAERLDRELEARREAERALKGKVQALEQVEEARQQRALEARARRSRWRSP